MKPNGLALSPDEKTLYVSDNGARRRALIAADRGPDGKVSNARVIHDFGTGRGIDGMTVTTDGRIVAASALEGKPAVIVLSPDGKILDGIAVPEVPANVEFGGDDRKTLYICAGKSLYRIKTTMTGHHLWPPPQEELDRAMRFTKMHGIGNDYVYVSTFDQRAAGRPGRAGACRSATATSGSAATA